MARVHTLNNLFEILLPHGKHMVYFCKVFLLLLKEVHILNLLSIGFYMSQLK